MATRMNKIKNCPHALTCPLLTTIERLEIIGVKAKEIKTIYGNIIIIENNDFDDDWGIL